MYKENKCGILRTQRFIHIFLCIWTFTALSGRNVLVSIQRTFLYIWSSLFTVVALPFMPPELLCKRYKTGAVCRWHSIAIAPPTSRCSLMALDLSCPAQSKIISWDSSNKSVMYRWCQNFHFIAKDLQKFWNYCSDLIYICECVIFGISFYINTFLP